MTKPRSKEFKDKTTVSAEDPIMMPYEIDKAYSTSMTLFDSVAATLSLNARVLQVLAPGLESNELKEAQATLDRQIVAYRTALLEAWESHMGEIGAAATLKEEHDHRND